MKRIISSILIIAVLISSLTFCSDSNNEKEKESMVEFLTTKDMINYPRPQFFRSNWLTLNGEWDFVFDDKNVGEDEKYYINFPQEQKINVPFTYETTLSGIGEERVHNYVWYNKSLVLPEIDPNNKLILNFEGSDYYTKVWVNGNFAGENTGGYHRFSFDVTDFVKAGDNQITVKVEDSLSLDQARGKQRYKNESFGCWYIQTTGIWKTVWLETVPENYFTYVKNTPDYDHGTVSLEYEIDASYSDCNKYRYSIETVISFDGKVTNQTSLRLSSNHAEKVMSIYEDNTKNEIKYWSPEEPNLYDIEYRLYRNEELIDTVSSYFGVRKISIDGDKLLLNGEQLHLKMLLDQGYWKESHLTPPSGQALIDDIDLVLEYGYNGVRKHQKVEDERFLYWCDVKGIFVWSEMASFYSFSDRATSSFTDEWKKVVRQNYNHPSIITWVPFNESWGFTELANKNDSTQRNYINSIYYLTKSMDKTRPVITNDGWEHTISDIITIHDYRQNGDELYAAFTDDDLEILNGLIEYSCSKKLLASGYKYNGQPVIMSEYGGIALQSDSGWGYGEMASGEEDFLNKFREVTETVAKIPYISGYCYTQITDVQQEINGLLKENHTAKFSDEGIKEIRRINEEAFNNK